MGVEEMETTPPPPPPPGARTDGEVFELAPPLRAVLTVPGWMQQTKVSPWPPVSPDTIPTVNKYKDEPTTFSWIVQNDALFVKWVLERTDDFSGENMRLMNMYFRQHYQRGSSPHPKSCPPTLPYIPTSHESAMSQPNVTPPMSFLMAEMRDLMYQMQDLFQLVEGHRANVGAVEGSGEGPYDDWQ